MNVIDKTISVVGCGWLGLPLAKQLLEKNYTVKGSRTSSDAAHSLNGDGIEGHQLLLDPHLKCSTIRDLLDCDVLIVNIPPRRRDDIEIYHWDQMCALVDAAKKAKVAHVIFVSSTSVYPSVNRSVSESDALNPDKPSGRVLKRVEQLWLESFNATVIRFGGLIGGERQPGRFLAGKRRLKNGNAPVNLIHRDDCIEIIAQIIEGNFWNEIYNACAPQHPKRSDMYIAAAEKLGLEPPSFEDNTENWKEIDSSKLEVDLEYSWIHPDPMHF